MSRKQNWGRRRSDNQAYPKMPDKGVLPRGLTPVTGTRRKGASSPKLLSIDIVIPFPVESNYDRLRKAIRDSGVSEGTYDYSDVSAQRPTMSIDGHFSSVLEVTTIAKKMFPDIEIERLKLDEEGQMIGGRGRMVSIDTLLAEERRLDEGYSL